MNKLNIFIKKKSIWFSNYYMKLILFVNEITINTIGPKILFLNNQIFGFVKYYNVGIMLKYFKAKNIL